MKLLDLESEEFQGLSLRFLDDDVANFSTTSFQSFHFSSKTVF